MDDISGIMEGSAFDNHHYVQFSTILSDNIHAYPPRDGLARGSRSSTPVKHHHHDNHRNSPLDAFDGNDFTDSIGPGHSMFSTLQDSLRSSSPPWIRNPTKQAPMRSVDGRRASPKRGSLLGPFAFMAQSIGELKSGNMQPADLITLRKQLTLLRLQMQSRIGEDRLVAEEQILTAWYIVTEKEEEAHALETRTTQFKTVYTTQRRLEEMERQVENAYESLIPTFEKLAKFNEIKAAQRERKEFLKSPKSFKDKTKTNQDYAQKILDLERAVKHLDRINEKKGRMHKTPILASVHRLNSLTPESLKKRESFLGASPNGQQQSTLPKTVSFFGDVEGDMAKPLTDVDTIFDDKVITANTNANADPDMPVLKTINTSNQPGNTAANGVKASTSNGNKSSFASAKDMLKPTASMKQGSLASASNDAAQYSSAKDSLKPTTPNNANSTPNKQPAGSSGGSGGESFSNVKDALKPTASRDEEKALSQDKAAVPSPHQAAKETLKATPARQPSKMDEGVNSTMAQPIIAMKETLRPPSVREASVNSSAANTGTDGVAAASSSAESGDVSANGEKPTEFVRKASMFGKLVRKASGLMDGKSGSSVGTTPQDTSGAGLFASAAATPNADGSVGAGNENKPPSASGSNNHHDDADDFGGDIVSGDLNDLLGTGPIPSASKPDSNISSAAIGSGNGATKTTAATNKGPVEIVPLTSENLRRSSATGFNTNETDANGVNDKNNNNPPSAMDTASNADGSDAGKKKGRNFMKGFRKRTSFMFGGSGEYNKKSSEKGGSETGSNPDKPRPSVELAAGSGNVTGGDAVMSPGSQVNDEIASVSDMTADDTLGKKKARKPSMKGFIKRTSFLFGGSDKNNVDTAIPEDEPVDFTEMSSPGQPASGEAFDALAGIAGNENASFASSHAGSESAEAKRRRPSFKGLVKRTSSIFGTSSKDKDKDTASLEGSGTAGIAVSGAEDTQSVASSVEGKKKGGLFSSSLFRRKSASGFEG